jgi:D-alanyl-D-alanine carboxypeptidase
LVHWRLIAIGLAVGIAAVGAGAADAVPPAHKADRALQRSLERLTMRPGGAPGAIAVIQRGRQRRVHSAGVARIDGQLPLRVRKHMRIASVSKAFSGAAALALVDEGVLSLGDTLGTHLPDLPAEWHPVTLRQLLAHTSGLPDYTSSPQFAAALGESPTLAPPPRQLLDFVAAQPLGFPPGSRYRYSNSDNVAIALMIEAVTGTGYERVLRAKVLRPHRLGRTAMGAGTVLPRPFIHGYSSGPGARPEDVSQLVAFGGWAWASGGIVSTPGNLNRFVRAYVGGGLFGDPLRRRQRSFVDGATSDPPGPGTNAAGLGLFRYRTRCGTVLGHTGSILGYTQLIAASPNGRRSLTFTITTQATDELVPELRRAQVRAVCAALADR